MPNSILWIALVVLWVFVLFPMLANRHPRIRRTTDAALATRVLHRGGTRRRAQKGPATGHDTDPDWTPAPRRRRHFHGDDAEDRMTTKAEEAVVDEDLAAPAGAEPADRETDQETIGSDSPARDSGEVPDRDAEAEDEPEEAESDRPAAAMVARIPPAPTAAPADEDELPGDREDSRETGDLAEGDEGDFTPSRRGRGGYDPEADAIARAARYRFRQRAALGLVLAVLLFAAGGVVLNPMLWWGCALSAVALVAYLAYLRRQVRYEEEIRRRRAARLAGGQREPRPQAEEREVAEPGAEAPGEFRSHRRHGMDRNAARALRRRAVVLDVDDEDPLFDHLELFDAAAARATRNRAAGGEIRRAAGE
ncbi:MAG: hypothetical protein J2P18_13840 [Nocardia sp.]|nr:hypothetical protein [Nocardia sp.]